MASCDRVNSSLRAQHMPSHLRYLEGKLKNCRGQNLSYLALFPSANTPLRGVVLYLHGIGDHSRRYFHLYERLCNADFGVLAYDLVSHGSSDLDRHGLRAHSAKFQYFVDDTSEFIKMAKTQLYQQLEISSPNDEPKFILAGMSYGTLIGLYTILSGKHDFSGVVMVAPALLVEMTTTLRVQAFFARPLSRLIPKARIVPGVNGDYLCRDQDYVDDFKADPLTVSEPVTARMGAETLKAMKALKVDKRVEDKESALCKLPVLMMMGSNDKVTSLELAQVFYKRLAASDKEFKVFDGYFHSLFDDPEHEVVFSHLDNWLKTRFPLPGGFNKVDKIDEEETVKIQAEVKKNEAKAVEATTTVKEKNLVNEVRAVTVETVDATNTSSATEEAKVEVVETPVEAKEELKAATSGTTVAVPEESKVEVIQTSAVRKQIPEAEVVETIVAVSKEAKNEVVEPTAPVTDEAKAEVVEDPVEAKAKVLDTIVAVPEELKIEVIQGGT